jgi:hypothetical protein
MKMSRLTLIAVLLLITSSAFAQITGERPVSTPVYGPSTVVSSAIASDGDGFLAVWLGYPDRGGIYYSRIASDGTVLNPFGIFLTNASSGSGYAVAWTGDRYLLVWNESNSIVGMQLAADGRIVTPAHVILAKAGILGRRALASNGNVNVLLTSAGIAVLDQDANVIDVDTSRFPGTAAYVTGSGEFVLTAGGGTMRLDSSGRYATRTTRGWPGVIACRAGECRTVFNNGKGHLAFAGYDPSSLVVGPVQELPIDQSAFDFAATADGYVLVTKSNILQRLDPDGHPLGASIVLPGPVASDVTIASNGREEAVLRILSNGSLTSVIVTPAAVTQPNAIALSANAQRDIAIARGNANYLAVWIEKDGTYAGRLSLDGLPLDGRGILLGPNTGSPSVIFDGASYLVMLGNQAPPGYGIVSKPPNSIVRIDPSTGGVMSVFRITAGSLRVASNGFSRIAVWTEGSRLVAAFLTPDGTLASAPVFIAAPPPSTTMGTLSVAWNGTMWLVVWDEDQISYPFFEGPQSAIPLAIRGVRLSSELIPLDTQPITITENEYIVSSRVASDGRDFLVAWSSAVPYKNQLTVRRVLATGAPSDTKLLSHGTLQDLVWDGMSYDLAFSGGDPLDLAASRLTASGQLLETLAISATAGDDRFASLVPLGNGSILAGYTRVAFEPLYGGVERAFVGTLHALREHPSQPH